MSKVLIVAEHLNGQLNSATARCVSCAQALKADSIDIVVLSDAPDAVAAQVAKLAAGYTHVFGPSTTFGKDLMPCIAALLGVAQVSDLMAVDGAHAFKRPIYAGNAIISVTAPADKTVVATVRTASWPAAA